jgi:hypothetical protein
LAAISRAATLLAVLLAVSACHRQPSDDTNLLLGRCSTRVRAKGPVARLPAEPVLRPGFGGIIGTLVDSGGALPHYPVMAITPGDFPNAALASAIPDSLGGFVFDALAPGHYRLFVHAISHRPDSTDVDVVAGRVDTVRILLQYFGCIG